MNNNKHFDEQVRNFISKNYTRLTDEIYKLFAADKKYNFFSKTFQRIYDSKQRLVVLKDDNKTIDEERTKTNIRLQLHKKRKYDSKYYVEELEDISNLLSCDITSIFDEESLKTNIQNGVDVFYVFSEDELKILINEAETLTQHSSKFSLVFITFPIFGLSGIINITKSEKGFFDLYNSNKKTNIDITYQISCAIRPDYNASGIKSIGESCGLLDFEGEFFHTLKLVSDKIEFSKYKYLPFLDKPITYFYENTYKIDDSLADGNYHILDSYKKPVTDREYTM